MANFIPYTQNQLMLLPPDIREFIPEGHIVYLIDEIVESLDLSSFYRKIKNDEGGRPCYHPKMLLKVLLYAYIIGIRSSRKIAERLRSDVFFMYLSGMQYPDFRTISDFRKNNISEIEDVFKQVVLICIELGVSRVGYIALDGTKIRASAGKKKTYKKEQLEKVIREIEREIKEILEEAEEIDKMEDEIYGDREGDKIYKEILKREKLKKKIEEAKKKLEERGWKEINITDFDARFMKHADNSRNLYYNVQLAVDENQIIVANDVVRDKTDQHQFIPMYEKIKENIKAEPIKICADMGYYTNKAYVYIYKNKINAYIPDQMFEKEFKNGEIKNSRFSKRNFRYNSKKDAYECPEGGLLFYKRSFIKNGVKYKIYKGEDCKICKVKEFCTVKDYREITVSEADFMIEKMRKKLSTDKGKKEYIKRLYTVEPVIGDIKRNMGFTYFLLRGLKKVRGEFNLICIAHNIKKIYRLIESKKLKSKLRNLEKDLKNIREKIIELFSFYFKNYFPSKNFPSRQFSDSLQTPK